MERAGGSGGEGEKPTVDAIIRIDDYYSRNGYDGEVIFKSIYSGRSWFKVEAEAHSVLVICRTLDQHLWLLAVPLTERKQPFQRHPVNTVEGARQILQDLLALQERYIVKYRDMAMNPKRGGDAQQQQHQQGQAGGGDMCTMF